MMIRRSLSLSGKALWRHPVRTALGVCGIAVGVGAMLVMVAIGEGARAEIEARIESMGRNQLVVRPSEELPPPGRPGGRRQVPTLTLADAEAIGALPSVARVAPTRDGVARLKYGRLSMISDVRGTTFDYALVRNFPTVAGRYFTAEENRDAERVVVVGDRIRKRLFGDEDPVGQTMRLGTVPMKVIGVLIPKGVGLDGGSDEDEWVLVPLNTALRRVTNLDHLSGLFVEAVDGQPLARAEAQIAELLRERHRLDELGKGDDFTIAVQDRVGEAELQANEQFRRLIIGIASVALLVGGVGILSIMLLSVRERRNEVGLRVALGARSRDVRRQFLIEAMMLGGTGGILGAGAGLIVALAVGRSTQWPTAVSLEALAVAVGASLLVTVVFGVLPAQRAAGLDPIEALRAD